MSKFLQQLQELSTTQKIALCTAGGMAVAYMIYRYSTQSADAKTNGANVVEEQQEEFDEYRKGTHTKILILGLSDSGKTSLVARFTNDKLAEDYQPTNGFNVKTVDLDGDKIELWEIGGKLSKYWYTYLPETGVLTFMVNCSDTESFPTVRNELEKLLDNDGLKHDCTKFVILLNKRDLTGDKTYENVVNKILPDESYRKGRIIRIVEASLLTDSAENIENIKNLILKLLRN